MNKPAAHPTMTPTFAENDMLRVDNKRAFRVVKVLGVGGMAMVRTPEQRAAERSPQAKPSFEHRAPRRRRRTPRRHD